MAFGSIEANVGIIGVELAKLTVFSYTYTCTDANSTVHGSMLGGDVTYTGSNTIVYADVTSVNATNIGGGTASVAATATSPYRPAVAYVPGNTVTVVGDVISGGVLTVSGATVSAIGAIGPRISGSVISTGASTIGAFAEVGGDMHSGGVATTGANSVVGANGNGSVLLNGSVSTGDTAIVHGDVWAEDNSGTTGFATIGANSIVDGNVDGAGATYTNVISPSASVDSENNVTNKPGLSAVRTDVLAEAQQVKDAQDTLFRMGTSKTLLSVGIGANMDVDKTLLAVIYTADYLTTTADTTLILQGNKSDDQSWVFNIRDYIAFGGKTKVVMKDIGKNAGVY